MTSSSETVTHDDVVLVEREHLVELLLWATHQPACPVVKNAALHLERSLTAPEPPAAWFDTAARKMPRWRLSVLVGLSMCAAVVFVLVGVTWAVSR